MEPVSIAIICVAVFGAVAALTAFIRQLLLSRDKKLNDQAQQRAVKQEVDDLEKLRKEMTTAKRFDAHYQVLGSNKDATQYLDRKIEELFNRKLELIQRYSEVTLRESSAIISGQHSPARKQVCDKLRIEVENELKSYDKELNNLQVRRSYLWESNKDLERYLLEQEAKRNEQLDKVYLRHSEMLEKLYLRHNENSESMAKLTVEAGTSAYKESVHATGNLLNGLFKMSENLSPEAAPTELARRKKVLAVQMELNAEDSADTPRPSRRETKAMS